MLVAVGMVNTTVTTENFSKSHVTMSLCYHNLTWHHVNTRLHQYNNERPPWPPYTNIRTTSGQQMGRLDEWGTRRRCVSCSRLQGIFFFPFFLLCITNNFFTYRLIMMRPNVTTPPPRLQLHLITQKGPNNSIYSRYRTTLFFS